MIKPMFVPKKERETIAEREKVEAEMDAEWERREAGGKREDWEGGERRGGLAHPFTHTCLARRLRHIRLDTLLRFFQTRHRSL